MTSDLPVWLKLWYKGIDIAATVIASTLSAGIVAAIATLTWRWNKRRDLIHEEAKQRQQARIDNELRDESRRQEQVAYVARLERERDEFAAAIRNATTPSRLRDLCSEYLQWLQTKGLANSSGNQKS